MSVVTCRACCPSCGLHFASNGAFDLHLSEREGHRDPREVRRRDKSAALEVRTTDGECRMLAVGDVTRGWEVAPEAPVVIWEVVGARAKAAQNFRHSVQEAVG